MALSSHNETLLVLNHVICLLEKVSVDCWLWQQTNTVVPDQLLLYRGCRKLPKYRRFQAKNRGDAMVFCTLETGIFGLISEGQLMVRIRKIKSENKKTFLIFFSWILSVANPNFVDK
jgi:hypothetical protein